MSISTTKDVCLQMQRDFYFVFRMDFYLMSHHIRQGCAFPAHYICLYNTTNLTPDHLQRYHSSLILMFYTYFKLCYFLLSNQAHFQDVPFVLELAWDHCCPSSLQIRPQTGLPGGPVPALWAIHPAVRQAVFPLSCQNSTVCFFSQRPPSEQRWPRMASM